MQTIALLEQQEVVFFGKAATEYVPPDFVVYASHESSILIANNIYTHNRLIFIAIALLTLLIGCNPIQATSTPVTTPKPFVFKITKVVDKLAGEPIKTNYLTITIETGEDDPIEYQANNIGEYRVEIPVGAEAFVLVEAPGYKDWDLVLRSNASKYMEGPVELVPVDSPETITGSIARRITQIFLIKVDG